jgi:hypothetical protein
MAHERQDILNHVINDEWIEENSLGYTHEGIDLLYQVKN